MQFDKTIDAVSYHFTPGRLLELHITTSNIEKPWLALDMVLKDLHIAQNTIESTEYSYIHDEKKGRSILCVVTLKTGTVYSLGGDI